MHTTPTAEFVSMLFTKNHQKRVKKLLPERWDIDRTLRILLADRLSDFLSVSLLQLVGTPNAAAGSDFVLLPMPNTVGAAYALLYSTIHLGLFFCCQGQTLQSIWYAGQGGVV